MKLVDFPDSAKLVFNCKHCHYNIVESVVFVMCYIQVTLSVCLSLN